MVLSPEVRQMFQSMRQALQLTSLGTFTNGLKGSRAQFCKKTHLQNTDVLLTKADVVGFRGLTVNIHPDHGGRTALGITLEQQAAAGAQALHLSSEHTYERFVPSGAPNFAPSHWEGILLRKKWGQQGGD